MNSRFVLYTRVRDLYSIPKRLYAKKFPTNLSNSSKSSQEWMARQLNDQYVKRAKMENYRARSAFKLIELDDKYKFLQPGYFVVDIGASPGAWSQVAIKRVNAKKDNKESGKVVSVDLNFISPITGVTVICGDFTQVSTQKQIIDQFGNSLPEVVLSDMAPNATGIGDFDNKRIVDLALSALIFSVQHLKVGGTFLCKVWDGSEVNKLEAHIEKFFTSVRRVKPGASRTHSAEVFLLGRQFKGTITD